MNTNATPSSAASDTEPYPAVAAASAVTASATAFLSSFTTDATEPTSPSSGSAMATLSNLSSYAAIASHSVTVGSPAGIQVVDTTGAGDIFGGSAMSQFLSCGKLPSALTEEDLIRIVRFACTAASLSTQKHGGISSIPDFNEVRQYLDSLG